MIGTKGLEGVSLDNIEGHLRAGVGRWVECGTRREASKIATQMHRRGINVWVVGRTVERLPDRDEQPNPTEPNQP